MAKNRRSLSSILVPSFLQQIPATSPLTSPTSSTFISRMRSQSSVSSSVNHNISNEDTGWRLSTTSTTSRDSPPPDFLLDDDPFACLAPVEPVAQRTIQPQPPSGLASSPPNPRSPPKKVAVTIPPTASSGISAHPGLPCAFSAARIQPRPASQKPAFASRPSLPSLHTLSTMNVVLTKKVRSAISPLAFPLMIQQNLVLVLRSAKAALEPVFRSSLGIIQKGIERPLQECCRIRPSAILNPYHLGRSLCCQVKFAPRLPLKNLVLPKG
jgi:hypothetical protein